MRGANSIGAGGSALILVDGVETDITTVNSEDIESISVLKDASSTAVYGSRGTFGVILITTKRPEKGQMKITYNGSYNFYKRTVTPELVDNGYDWTTSYLEAYTNSYATDPTNINPTNYNEIFFSDIDDDDLWFKARLAFITIDDKRNKEKRYYVNYLIQAKCIERAKRYVDEVMGKTMIDYELKSLSETKILDVFEHKA